MSKSLKELADELKTYIIELQSDAHNRGNIKYGRYNNIKLEFDFNRNKKPHVIVQLAISSAEYDLRTLEKLNGSLGPDDRYVSKWLSKSGISIHLMDCWRNAEQNQGRVDDKYKV